MHVLVIPSWYPTCTGDINGSFFREQAHALKRRGCIVGVVAPQLASLRSWPSVTTSVFRAQIQNDLGIPTYQSSGINWFPVMRGRALDLWVSHGNRLYAQYVLDRGVPDVIHAHSMLNAGVLAAKIAQAHGVPFVVTEHRSVFGLGTVSATDLAHSKAVAQLAARRFAVSGALANVLEGSLGDTGSDWEVMPNIVSPEFLSYPLTKRCATSGFRFINVAMMTANKNQKNIILAFHRAFRNDDSVQLTIVGDGPQKYSLEKLIDELALRKQVRMPGKLSRQQVLGEVAAADVFVLASNYETFGVSVVEALALGKTVIATKCGGPESIVEKGDGITVPIDDVDALAAAMQKLYAEQDSYDPQSIRNSCGIRYSETIVTDRIMSVYSDVVTDQWRFQGQPRSYLPATGDNS